MKQLGVEIMNKNLVKEIENAKVISILRGIETDVILKVANALYNGGIKFMEVTFDHKTCDFQKTTQAIEILSKEFAGRMQIGAGTVTTVELVHIAAKAGAKFIISPDCNEEVIRETKKLGMVSIPGAFTATEILKAHYAGADFVKIFPAGAVNTDYIKALRGPIPQVKLMAVGGIDASNAAAYIKAGCSGVGVGGKLANRKFIEEGRFELLTQAAEELIAAIEGETV